MTKNIPDQVMPWQLVQSGERVRGQVLLAQMPRLAQILLNKRGEAKVELVFGCDEAGRCCVHGYIQSRPQLICQRCLQPMQWPLDIQVRLILMAAESEIKAWCDDYEPWIVAWEEIASLWSLIEEELLLAFPIAARHSVDECPEGDLLKQVAEEDKYRSSPFSVLKQLKH